MPQVEVAVHLELMREKTKHFPLIEEPQAYTTARIWHCKYESLDRIKALCNLEVLVIATYPDSSFNPIANLRKLRHLRVLHFPHAHDLEPLATLHGLETLSLASLPSWDSSGKVLSVKSFEPLAHLTRLQHLELFGVRPLSGGLKPFNRLHTLRSARFSKLPKSEVAKFYSDAGVSNEFAPRATFAAA